MASLTKRIVPKTAASEATVVIYFSFDVTVNTVSAKCVMC